MSKERYDDTEAEECANKNGYKLFYALAEVERLGDEVKRLRKVEREHLRGDEHHKGCACELAFIYEVAGTWKVEVGQLRDEVERLRAALRKGPYDD